MFSPAINEPADVGTGSESATNQEEEPTVPAKPKPKPVRVKASKVVTLEPFPESTAPPAAPQSLQFIMDGEKPTIEALTRELLVVEGDISDLQHGHAEVVAQVDWLRRVYKDVLSAKEEFEREKEEFEEEKVKFFDELKERMEAYFEERKGAGGGGGSDGEADSDYYEDEKTVSQRLVKLDSVKVCTHL